MARNSELRKWANFLNVIGGILMIVVRVLEIIPLPSLERILFAIVGLILGVITLMATGFVKKDISIPNHWLTYLIIVIVDYFLGANIGTLFVLIACILLIFAAL